MKLSNENSIKFAKIKLTLQYTLTTLIVVIILIASFYAIYSSSSYRNFDASLKNRALSIAVALSGQEENGIENLKNIPEFIKYYKVSNESIYVVDNKLNVIFSDSDTKLTPPPSLNEGFYTIETKEEGEQKPIRAYITRLSNTNYYLIVMRSFDDLESSLHDVLLSFLLLIPVILVIIVFLSYRFASSAIKPLEISIEKLKQFTSDISHELKTPISTIKATIDVALMKEGRDEKYFREKLLTLQSATERISKLVQDMLYLSRLDLDNYPVNKEPVHIKEMFEELKKEFESLGVSMGVQINFIPPPYEILYTDKSILFEILSIAIENAIKYNRKNGSVVVSYESEGSSKKIIVRDTGIGIEEKDLPHIFERFYRGEKSRSRETGGVGLGLSIAKRLAELINADIAIESKINVGTTFTLLLRS